MMRPIVILAASVLVAASPVPGAAPVGLWRNPSGSVVVRTELCGGDRLCGTVVWATPEAIADARDGGDPHLIGTQILRDYHRAGPGRWAGTVFVPAMGRGFSSTIEQKGANRITVSGCLFRGLFCRHQEWTRQDPARP